MLGKLRIALKKTFAYRERFEGKRAKFRDKLKRVPIQE